MKSRIIFHCIFLFLFLYNILHSQSAWFTQNSGVTTTLKAIYFVNSQTGFCAGDYSIVLKTTNGGEQWFSLNISTGINFNYLKFFNKDSGVAGSHLTDSIYFTTNGGNIWYLRDINTAYVSSGRCLDVPTFNYIFYYSAGYIYISSNNGMTWQSVYSSAGIKSVSFVNPNTGWVCGTYTIPYPPPYGTTYSEVRKTTNGGLNWITQISVQELSYSISRVFFKDAYTGFYNDFSSWSMRKTVNGGTNFVSMPEFGTMQNYYVMNFPSNDTGWFLGTRLMKTTNGAVNWSEMSITPSAAFYSGIFFIDDYTGWLTGSNGTILKTITGGITNITYYMNTTPENYKLGQNYPNPFNAITYINVEIPDLSYVKLNVYNSQGKNIMTLNNTELHSGFYTYKADLSNNPSGIYFYKLETDKFRSTKKMILIK